MSGVLRVSVSVGHTNRCPGARHEATALREFDVSKRYRDVLLAMLEQDRHRFDVVPIMLDLPIDRRVEVVNSAHYEETLDLAIDLHMNSFRRPEPNYVEVYHYCTPDGVSSGRGKAYGDAFLLPLIEEVGALDGKNDKLSEPFGDEEWERERYGFVRGVAPPALVIEPAFLSHDDTARRIIESGFVVLMAVGCYKGLVACLEV